MNLLLDTHSWIWLMSGDQHKFSRQTRNAIDRACAGHRCWLSVISLWEVSTLHARGRIRLSYNSGQLLQAARATPGIQLAPLSAEAAWDAGCLPMHGDPADRLIVATARELKATLVTSDSLILNLPALCRTLEAN